MASIKTMLRLLALAALALYAASGWAQFLTRFSVEAGAGNYVDVAGVGVGTADLVQGTLGENWSWSVFGLARAAYWRGNGAENRELADLSVAPVAHLERRMSSKVALYVDGSVGFHLLSHTKVNEGREFSTAFQFGEFIELGFAFGPGHRYNVGLRLQHVSNGGIRNPNDGLSYGTVVFQYRLAQR
jgi:hypothetical protein